MSEPGCPAVEAPEDDAAAEALRATRGADRRHWTASELATLGLDGFPVTARGFQLCLKKRGVASTRRRVRGGEALVYRHADLPRELRVAIDRRALAELPLAADEPARSQAALDKGQRDLIALSQLPEWARTRAQQRLAVVDAFETWLGTMRGRTHGQRAAAVFADAWSRGEIEQQHGPDVLPTFSWATLLRWRKTMHEQGAAALGGSDTPRRATIEANPAMLARAEAAIAEFPHLNGEKLHWILAAKFGRAETPSVRSCRRWLAAWKRDNRRLYASIVNPDAYKAKFVPAFGDASAAITELNQVWEFDDTPSDIVLADGQRYTVIGVIDVWSRRMMLQVHRTSTSAGISLLLRRALLTFGVPSVIRTDNGAAYVSRHITEVLRRLEVAHDVLPPFSPEKKPFIERALKTFAYDLVELLPGFVGHNVAGAQAIRARKTFAQRLFGRGSTVELRMTPEDFQRFCDDWCEAYHGRVHGTLKTTPALRAAQWPGRVRTIADERALDILLAPLAGGDGRRVVTKRGIRVEGGLFIAAELGDYVGETVECRQDPRDAGRIYVFDDTGRFVCIAEDPERSGVSRDEIAAAARQHVKAQLAERRQLLRARRREELPTTETIARDIITARIAAAPSVVAFPRPGQAHAPADLSQSRAAARADEAPVAPPRTERDAANEAALVKLAEQAAYRARRLEEQLDSEGRIARALKLFDELQAGRPRHAFEPDTLAWFDGYCRLSEFRTALHFRCGVAYEAIDRLVKRLSTGEVRDRKADRAALIAQGLAAWDALAAGLPVAETERAWFALYETTTEFLSALSTQRGVDIRRGFYRPIAGRRAETA
jgi:hypothetical protein